MRKLLSGIALFSIMMLASCEGSETYRGKWKAINGEETKSEIIFSENEMTLKNSATESRTWDYKQTSVELENGSSKYRINLENGLKYFIIFPNSDDLEKGAIADQNGEIIFIIGRNNYYSYQDVFGLQ